MKWKQEPSGVSPFHVTAGDIESWGGGWGEPRLKAGISIATSLFLSHLHELLDQFKIP